jgi:hypothetical protein
MIPSAQNVKDSITHYKLILKRERSNNIDKEKLKTIHEVLNEYDLVLKSENDRIVKYTCKKKIAK